MKIKDPQNETELVLAIKYQRALGVSAPTMWRREQAKLLTPINIFGTKYYRRSEIAEFERRAVAGEFAKPPRGAAKRKAGNHQPTTH